MLLHHKKIHSRQKLNICLTINNQKEKIKMDAGGQTTYMSLTLISVHHDLIKKLPRKLS